MKFIFIRHGKDDNNYRGGWSNLDITAEGKKQSFKLAKYLEGNNYNIKKIVTSDLKRALTTSTIINGTLNVPLELDKDLREMNNGDLAGMLNEEALKKYPNMFFNTLDWNQNYPNGESPKDFYDRINNWFQKNINLYKNKEGSIVFVTHGGVINIIYYIVKNLKWSNKEKSFKIGNCSMHILDVSKMAFDLENFSNYE